MWPSNGRAPPELDSADLGRTRLTSPARRPRSVKRRGAITGCNGRLLEVAEVASSAELTSSAKTATLRIGDQWNAINIIARSQTHPLKAVCELTENAIDANAKHVRIIRRRSKGRLYLEVIEDGEGVPSNSDNEPDFARIATHVCDSMKRHLDKHNRTGIHGEFGIGLLSLWSLGDELRMASATLDGRVFEMVLIRGKRSYSIRPLRGTHGIGGTRVVVGPLLPATKKVVTGEKLARYFSSELRDRIRKKISIDVTVAFFSATTVGCRILNA